ncbi:MAG: SNF2-related protein, partial [Ilumatobacteraceae bacterium]
DGPVWGEAPADGTIDVDAAAATLECVDLLRGLGIELITPEQLTRRAPRAAGTARPAHESAGRFGAKTLVDWKVVVDDTPVDEAVLQRAVEAGSQLVEAGGRWVQIGRAEARRALEQLARHRLDHGELSTIGVLRLAAELDGELDDDDDGDGDHRALVGTEWLHELLAGLPETVVEEAVEPAGFTATLRPYQRRGLGWLQFLHRVGLGGCLADDMGLGKTPTTLAHLASIPGPHLVVCPLSVVRNWQNECAKFVPLARVMVHHGNGRADAARLTELVAQHDIVITTYQVAARDIDAIAATTWSVAVFDEAQAVKNPETRTAKAMRKVPAGQHIALTGTPVENRLSELWSIIELVAPGLLGSQAQFRARFAQPIERHGDQQAAAALRQLTGPFLLRRTKADRSLVPDLPDKVEQIAWAALTREQAAMYQSVVDQLLHDAQQASGMKRRGLVLAALTRLKQICNHPAHALGDGSRLGGRSGKLTRFDELIVDLLDAGERALVFTQFREMGLLLQRHLHERFDLTVPFLHGGVTRSGRDRMVDEFQSGTSPSPLLLVSLKAGGTGLNLTAASRVVHYDRWWNPAVEDQATDRAWRIGQQQAVFVHKLVCQGTIEERVDALINDKRALAEAVIGTSGEAWLSELSTDELRDLVTLHTGAHT